MAQTAVQRQSVTSRTIAEVSRVVFERSLQSKGFRRRAPHSFRPTADLTHAIHFQASRWGTRAVGSFTVNVSINSVTAYEIWSGSAFPANPATALFPMWRRIGHLTPENLDHWWQVDEAADVDQLSTEIVALIEAYALPLFDRFPTEAHLLAEYRTGRAPSGPVPNPLIIWAILEWHAGARTEAQRLMKQALTDCRVTRFRPTICLIAQRMQLAVSEP